MHHTRINADIYFAQTFYELLFLKIINYTYSIIYFELKTIYLCQLKIERHNY